MSMAKTIRLVWGAFLAALVLVPSASAADIFYSQSGGGSGASCASTKSGAQFNTSSSDWTPGNTLHICGTWTLAANTNALTTQGAGSAGSPITIKFESGALLQSPVFPSLPSAAVHIAHSFITVDGGTNGIIQNTLNGSNGTGDCASGGAGGGPCQGSDGTIIGTCLGGPCTFAQDSRAIVSDSSATNVIAQNVTVRDLFVRVVNPNYRDNFGNGIDSTGIALSGNHSRVTGNTVSQSNIGIAFLCGNCNGANDLEIDHNTLSACNHFLGGGTSDAPVAPMIEDNIRIHDNDFQGNATMWDENAVFTHNEYHRNGIQIVVDSGSCTQACQITNLKVYNNYFHGSWSVINPGGTNGPSQMNAPLFIDDQGTNSVPGFIFVNNVVAMAPNDGGGVAGSYAVDESQNGTSAGSIIVANNTLYQSAGGGTCWHINNTTTMTFTGNISDGCGYAYNNQGTTGDATNVNGNLWFNTAGSPTSGWIYPGPIWSASKTYGFNGVVTCPASLCPTSPQQYYSLIASNTNHNPQSSPSDWTGFGTGCQGGTGCGFNSWQGGLFDTSGPGIANPLLNTSTFTLTSSSPAIGAAPNLTSLLPCSTYPALCQGAPQTFGVGGSCGTGCLTRPSSGNWDIGAYPFAAAVPVPPTITTTSLPNGTVAIPYSQTLAASGDVPMTWSVTGGTLTPCNLTLSSAGLLSGTPPTATTCNFTVQASNDAGMATKALSVTIVAPTVGLSSTSINFGNQAVGTGSAGTSVTLTNTGAAVLLITSITAASGSDYSDVSNCPLSPSTLGIGNSCTITTTFTPTIAGLRNGTITIVDNAGNSPQVINLTGMGLGITNTVWKGVFRGGAILK